MRSDRGAAMVAGALAAWFVVTLLSQHPRRKTEWLRDLLPGGLIPDWRFFAPEPVQHDLVLVHRTVAANGDQTRWRVTTPVSDRSLLHLVWFPQRRMEKALHEIAGELLGQAATGTRTWTSHHTFGLCRDHVIRAARREPAGHHSIVIGVQFGLLRRPGEEMLLVSPFIPCTKETAR
ncbi:hypothetical protein E1292_19230 [Nonomuraea deserti]|uniref:Uncharacterized protein n=1 Tax=Nonomuraea deserti TaxID=1848322 RepID=A0A4R4VFE7_9ACTN|nr:hypothetical protein [Nonomuraea deserti]TDD04278.1 hypothetical protein E1292_19230 [Nonomuraea deserti]